MEFLSTGKKKVMRKFVFSADLIKEKEIENYFLADLKKAF